MTIPGRTLGADAPNCGSTAQNNYGNRWTGCQSGRRVVFDDSPLPDGVTAVTATAVDLVNDQSPVTRQWSFYMDRGAPAVTPSGPLWDHRNQSGNNADHRNEGLYDSDYTLHLDATDGVHNGTPDQRRSGVKSIAVQVDGIQKVFTTQPQTCTTVNGKTQCSDTCRPDSCPLSADYTLHSDDYTDGDHMINVVTTDYAGNSTNTSWTVTVDRQGDIYRAHEEADQPTQGNPELLEDDWARPNSFDARREEYDIIQTRDTVSCDQSSSGCAETRARSRNGETDPSQPDTFVLYRGTSPDDSRLEYVADIQELAHTVEGLSPDRAGPINDALATWQTPPPGHAATYDHYTTTVPDEDEQGNDTTLNADIFVDDETKFPLKETLTAPDGTSETNYFTYEKQRLTSAEAPASVFSVDKPSNLDGDKEVTYTGSSSSNTMTDPETGQSFTPFTLGNTPIVGGATLCLSTKVTISEVAPAEPALSQAVLQGIVPDPSGPSLQGRVFYGAPSTCNPGTGGVDDVRLDVSTVAQGSTLAAARHRYYVDAVNDLASEPEDSDPSRMGAVPVTVGGAQAMAYVLPLDEEREGALIEIGGLSIMIAGYFEKTDISLLAEELQQ